MHARTHVPIYYINLDRRTDRRAWMETRLSALALEAERISAYTPDDVPDDILQARDALRWRQPLFENEIACCLSHRKALRRFLESGAPMAVILEDDVHLAKCFREQIMHLTERSDFDVVQLEACNGEIRTGVPGRAIVDGSAIHPIAQTGYGAAAYLITRRGAQLYTSRPLDLSATADEWLFDMRFSKPRGVRAVQLVPGIAVQEYRSIPGEYRLHDSDLVNSRNLHRRRCGRTLFPHFDSKLARRSLRPIFYALRFVITVSRTGLAYYRGKKMQIAYADGTPAATLPKASDRGG